LSPFLQDIEQASEGATRIWKTIKGFAANDVVEGLWRYRERCHVTR
jgi:hypothetical protein